MNATRSRHQASIEADPALPIIRITRDFDATPAELMRAHTDPVLFARWVGPNGMETEILDWDATTGGRWRYVARRDGMEFAFHGSRRIPLNRAWVEDLMRTANNSSGLELVAEPDSPVR